MKKVTIIILTLLIIGGLLFTNRDSAIYILSQKDNKSTSKNKTKNGISSKIDSLLNIKKAIKPVKAIHLIVFKAEKRVDFFVTDSTYKKHLISSHLAKLSSTINGTKLYNESINLPEGKYKIESITKDSTPYIVLNFPNEFDINKQISDNRPILDTKISIGTNDNNIILDGSAFNQFLQFNTLISPSNIEILIVPNDFRNGEPIPFCLTCPPWIEELYGSLRMRLNDFELF